MLGATEVLVIGSQAPHASVAGELPVEAARSVAVGVAALRDDPDDAKADLIDGSIGEASMFPATFGYHAQGVVETTMVLPSGWRKRLVRFETPATNGVVAWCLEPHDLWVSKAIASRPKDAAFCRALLKRGLVHAETLRDRLAKVKNLDERVRLGVRARVSA